MAPMFFWTLGLEEFSLVPIWHQSCSDTSPEVRVTEITLFSIKSSVFIQAVISVRKNIKYKFNLSSIIRRNRFAFYHLFYETKFKLFQYYRVIKFRLIYHDLTIGISRRINDLCIRPDASTENRCVGTSQNSYVTRLSCENRELNI